MLHNTVKWVRKQLKKLFSLLFGKNKAPIYVQPIIDAAGCRGYVESYSNKADSLHLDIKKRIYEEDIQKHFIAIMSKLAPYFRKGKARLAIDFQEQGFYGKTDNPHIIRTAYKKKSYSKAFKFPTLSLLTGKKEERIPLFALPWHVGQDLVETVDMLLSTVMPWLGKVEVVEFDRGFQSKELIYYLAGKKIPYLMHSKKAGTYLKTLVEKTKSFYRGVYEKKFTMNKTTYKVKSFLYVCKDIEKKDWLFLSSIWFKDKWQVRNLYRNRWQIETNYAVHNAAHLMSRSTDYMIRYFYYVADVLLQVLWRIAASRIPFRTFLFSMIVGTERMRAKKPYFAQT